MWGRLGEFEDWKVHRIRKRSLARAGDTEGQRGELEVGQNVWELETPAGGQRWARPSVSSTYLATPPGGDALLRAGGRKRLGRDVQHRGPPARALPGARHWRGLFSRTTLKLHLWLRLRHPEEAKPPAHFRDGPGWCTPWRSTSSPRRAGPMGQLVKDWGRRGGARGKYACSVNSAPWTSAPRGGDSYSAERLKRVKLFLSLGADRFWE